MNKNDNKKWKVLPLSVCQGLCTSGLNDSKKSQSETKELPVPNELDVDCCSLEGYCVTVKNYMVRIVICLSLSMSLTRQVSWFENSSGFLESRA